MGDDVQCMHVYNYVHRYIRREQHYARNIFRVLEDAWTWSRSKVVSLILEASEAREVIVDLVCAKKGLERSTLTSVLPSAFDSDQCPGKL